MTTLQNCFTLFICFGGIVLLSFPVAWVLRALSRAHPPRPIHKHIHPTARVEGCAVIVSGDVEYLQNQMHYFVNGSGATWTKLKAGGWKFEHPLADPHVVADAINHNSDQL